VRFPLAHTVPLALLALTGLGGPAAAGPGSAFEPAAPSLAAPAREDALPGVLDLAQDELRTARDPSNTWPALVEARLRQLRERIEPDADARDHGAAKSLVAQLDRLMRIAGRSADVAVTVRDLNTGAVVFDHHGDEALNPASNQKILTAVAAVELLGADYRFETRVAVHEDTLVLVGEGDPSLQLDDLHTLAAEVAAVVDRSAIRRIVVDDSAFSERRFGPGYDDDGPGHSYMAPSGALSLQFNTVEIDIRATSSGRPVAVAVTPACDHLDVHATARTARGGSLRVKTTAEGAHTRVDVGGRLAPGAAAVRVRRRVTDPARFTGTAFASALAEAWGTAEPLPVERGLAPAAAQLVATHRSAPLTDVLSSALKFSNNFTTEQVLRTLGWRMSGEPGDWNNGARALEHFWAALGQDPGDLAFENASGLSRIGRVTTRALVDLLSMTVDADRDAALLWSSMPVAGREGTLRKRLTTTHGRVRAKTGTLRGASALSGVIADRKGAPRLGFSILLNGRIDARSSRRIQDRMVLALLDHVK
jgi:serine-type D-Ala-D-Ala carboxypeptidase/endopeptidase (penicillin-binding protein 4)